MKIKIFEHKLEARWDDVDANLHVTHTSYGHFCTQTRINWLSSIGCSMNELIKDGIGAALLHEDIRYLREIMLSEIVTVKLFLVNLSDDGVKWTFKHEIYTPKNKLAATNTIFGVWIDMAKRQRTKPPHKLLECLKGILADHNGLISVNDTN